MYVSKNFILQEFVPKSTFIRWGEKSLRFLNPQLFVIAQALRDTYGPITLNDWHRGGRFQLRGYRPPDTVTGGKESAHKRGMAIDVDFDDEIPQQVYATILKDKAFWTELGVTTMEDVNDTPTWLHIAIENWGKPGEIVIVNPIP